MPALSNVLKNIPEIKLDESKKKILLIYLLGLSAILFLYIYLLVRPEVRALTELIPKVRSRKAEIKAVRNDLPLEGKLNEKNRLAQIKLKNYEKKLSREKEIPALLESLSQTARSSRVKILGITPIPAPSQKKKENSGAIYYEIPISISAQSGYHELGSFVNKLENDERYMQISDISIRASRDNPKRHDVRFVVYAYTFKGEE